MTTQASASTPSVVGDFSGLHADEAMSLYGVRQGNVRSARMTLHGLERLDDRLRAHLRALCHPDARARFWLEELRQTDWRGAVFVAAVHGLGDRNGAVPDWVWWEDASGAPATSALVDGFEWGRSETALALASEFLTSRTAQRRAAGLAIHMAHSAGPTLSLDTWLRDPAGDVRGHALQAAGDAGVCSLGPQCLDALGDSDAACRLWAARSCVLLGASDRCVDVLWTAAFAEVLPSGCSPFALAIQRMSVPEAHGRLQEVARGPDRLRRLVQGSGLNGDPVYVPWLIAHMDHPELARAAGEAFTLITGADLNECQLWRARSDDCDTGPSDDPADPNVAVDRDEGLPWPDRSRIETWWTSHRANFTPGQRYFFGAAVSWDHCAKVLRDMSQRHRLLAAQYLCLLRPGTPLFATSAPAWRQRRRLQDVS